MSRSEFPESFKYETKHPIISISPSSRQRGHSDIFFSMLYLNSEEKQKQTFNKVILVTKQKQRLKPCVYVCAGCLASNFLFHNKKRQQHTWRMPLLNTSPSKTTLPISPCFNHRTSAGCGGATDLSQR